MQFDCFSKKKENKEKRRSLQLPIVSISAGNSPVHRLARDYHSPLRQFRRSDKDSACGLCGREVVEPRLLECLHSFCTRCLQSLHKEGQSPLWRDLDDGTLRIESSSSRSTSGDGSAASGYESELRGHSSTDSSCTDVKPTSAGIFTRRVSGKSVQYIVCPTCGSDSVLPLGGVSALPLNYVLLRRLISSDIDSGRSSVLCDLCNDDSKAETRCSQCLLRVCDAHSESHGRSRSRSRSMSRPLSSSQSTYCQLHPQSAANIYCATCHQVLCQLCCQSSHSKHSIVNVSLAAAERVRLIQDACDRARQVPELVTRAMQTLSLTEVEVDNETSQIEQEISLWSEQYRRSVEAHTTAVASAAKRARENVRKRFAEQSFALREKERDARIALSFAEQVLEELKADELLSLSSTVLQRLERVSDISPLSVPPQNDIRFSRDAPATDLLFGRLLTKAPDLNMCRIDTDGLQNLIVNTEHTITLELRDSNGQRLTVGGESVAAYYRRKDSNSVPLSANVIDRDNGCYSLVVCAPSPGAYYLAVTVDGKSIQGSPFSCSARLMKPIKHKGQYHCCSFCSTGRYDVACGCGSNTSHGRGCIHGHAGHPGTKHWSCCGNTDRISQCNRLTSIYHFSL